jgi:CubicO group peptidase (beta-lactamase class C family)
MIPFADDAYTYYSPDMRKIALSVQAGDSPIGAAFHYNNFHPLLEGLIIERATGMHVYGQFVYVAPRKNVVVVRLGTSQMKPSAGPWPSTA